MHTCPGRKVVMRRQISNSEFCTIIIYLRKWRIMAKQLQKNLKTKKTRPLPIRCVLPCILFDLIEQPTRKSILQTPVRLAQRDAINPIPQTPTRKIEVDLSNPSPMVAHETYRKAKQPGDVVPQVDLLSSAQKKSTQIDRRKSFLSGQVKV